MVTVGQTDGFAVHSLLIFVGVRGIEWAIYRVKN
jgi:hypothetical protein